MQKQGPTIFLAYAIIRVEKIKTRQNLTQREQHNERTKETPNADEQRFDLNQEYVKAPDQSVVAAMDARLQEAAIDKPRANATLCVEVLMTGGPEATVWQRDRVTGQAADMRGSQWAADVVTFARQEWGKNLVSLVLHQDEHTPHFQAFVVPIVGSGGGRSGEANPKNLAEKLADTVPSRLSAHDLFSPSRLQQLQTDYADVVKEHGFKRGIAGSRAHHKEMGEMYGLREKTATEMALLVGAVSSERFVLESPPKNIFKQEEWRTKMEEKINAELTRQLAAANAKLALAGQVAVATAGGNEASERSRAWVEAEKKHKTGLDLKVMVAEMALGSKEDSITALERQLADAKENKVYMEARHKARLDSLALHAAQGTLPADFRKQGQAVWEAERVRAAAGQAKALALPLPNEDKYYERIRAAAYQWEKSAPGKPPQLVDLSNGARFTWDQVKPGDAGASLPEQLTQAVQATKQAALDRQRAIEAQALLVRRQEYEEAQLQKLVAQYQYSGQTVARLVVPPASVAGIVQRLGVNVASAKEKIGSDGLTTVTLTYNARASGNCLRISNIMEEAEKRGGKVYESADARVIRERGAYTDGQSGLGRNIEKEIEQTP